MNERRKVNTKTLTQSMLAIIAIAVLATTATAQEDGFVAGYPTDTKAQELFDEFDYQAAVQAYIWATPMLNSLGVNEAMQRDVGMKPGELATAIFDKRQLPHQTLMTANDEVVYTWSQLINTAETGPVVIETPKGGLGFAVDLFMRPLEDFGSLGPDKGEGGKFLFLPVGYDGEVPEGYFPVRMKYSDHFWFIFRTFPNNPGMTLDKAVELGKQEKAYPLTGPGAGKRGRAILIGDGPFAGARAFQGIGVHLFAEFHRLVQRHARIVRERAEDEPEVVGVFHFYRKVTLRHIPLVVDRQEEELSAFALVRPEAAEILERAHE